MWDESMKVYSNIQWSNPSVSSLQRTFPSGSIGRFAWIEHEKDMYNWQGSQICLIGFDELTHFTKNQFFYLLSRNRSTSWIRPYIRATCNPDPYSRVSEFISWWIDPETWFPIPERAWVIRYFMQDNDSYLRWDSIQDILDKYPYLLERPDFKLSKTQDLIKTVTFIPWSIYDNKKLLDVNPWYLGSLMSQTEEEKTKLLWGCRKPYNAPSTLFDYKALKNMFSNFIKEDTQHYISCDVALFWSDLAVIGIWKWLHLVKWYVYSTSSGDTIKKTIEAERQRLLIPKSSVVIDADGVWWWVADEDYVWFHNNWPTIDKENYANLKTQCAYKLAEAINLNIITLSWCEWYVDWQLSQTIRKWWKPIEISQNITKELSSIRRDNIDREWKLQINSKAEQKWLVWRSPDFADMMIMRMYFELWEKIYWFL